MWASFGTHFGVDLHSLPDVPPVPAALDYKLRPAIQEDVFFLTEAIHAADSAGTGRVSFQRIFGLSNLQLRYLLADLADTDIVGNEYSYPNFWVLETPAGTPLAATAAWVEAADGLGSNLIKAQQLSYILGAERWQAARPKLAQLGAIDIPRQPGALQLDSIYVRPSVRGQGLLPILLSRVMKQVAGQYPEAEKAQILLLEGNERALAAYRKCGFAEVRRIHTDNPAVAALVAGTGRILMERPLRTEMRM